jgi:hypothetical protein
LSAAYSPDVPPMKHKIAAAAKTCFRMTLLPMGFPTHVTNVGIILRNCPAIYGYPLSLSHCPHAYRERSRDNPRGAGHILPKPEGKQPGKKLGMAFEPSPPRRSWPLWDRRARSWCENSPSPRAPSPLPAQPLPEASQRVGMGPRNQARRYRLIVRTDGNRVRLYTRRGEV